MLRFVHLLAASTLLALACTPRAGEPIGLDPGTGAFAAGQAEYRALQRGAEWHVDIDFRFTNETGESLFVPVCRTPYPPTLEKWSGSEWITAYTPAVMLCLEAPLEIRPQGVHADTLRVRAGRRGSNVHPQMEVDVVGGTYRLVWTVNRSREAAGTGERLISTPFLIRE